MDFLIRYRNLTVLLVVVVGQLLLLAYQVKTNNNVPLLRVWAVSTVTPVEEGLEWVRRHTIGVVGDYFGLVKVKEQNEQLRKEMGKLKLENSFLKNQLSTADRAKELAVFQEHTPSTTLAARIIGNGTGENSKTVFVDRGSTSGVENGMAVITPDGIVGKIVAAYPISSMVMLITDTSSAAGVMSQKHHVHGTLKGQGNDPKCKVAYVQNEEVVDAGEWFYTSGDDGIFPRGLPVGQVASVADGRGMKNIFITPAGLQGGIDEVLIVLNGVHQPVPEQQIANAPVKILPPPSDEKNAPKPQDASPLTTEADRLRQEYKQVSEQQHIQMGTGLTAPDFSKIQSNAPRVAPQQQPPPQTPASGSQPAPQTPGQPKPPAQTAVVPKPPTPGPNPSAKAPSAGQQPPSDVRKSTAQQTPANVAKSTKAPAPTTKVQPTSPAPDAAPPRPRPPTLVTDPTDADPATEAVAERVQRQHKSTAPAEALPPAPTPKSTAPKSTSAPQRKSTSAVPPHP